MMRITSLLKLDWQTLLLGEEDWSFIPNVLIRTAIMFAVILVSLRMLGKRSVTQLSIFELGVIIGLGSAAGDPMFYKEVGLLVAFLVFIVVVGMYRLTTFLINKSDRVERVLEGEPAYVLENGKLIIETFEEETIAHEEFFSLLRQQQVSHLGQVKLAILETNGAVSIYYFPDEDVQWGLPVLPHLYDEPAKRVIAGRRYACTYCGELLKSDTNNEEAICNSCGKQQWVEAIREKRVV